MKIAVFHNLPSGGALRALYEKIRTLEKRGHQISLYLLATAKSDFLNLPDVSGEITEEPLQYKDNLSFLNDYQAASRKLAAKINQSDSAGVLVDKCQFFGSPLILQYLKKPNIFFAHEPLRIMEYEHLAFKQQETRQKWNDFLSRLNSVFFKNWIHWVKRSIIKREDRKSIHAASLVLTNSQFTAEWLKNVYQINAVVNYQGVDINFFRPTQSVARQSFVLSVGRMDFTKGHDFVVDVLSQIPQAKRPKCVVICDTVNASYLEDVKKKARQLNVSLQVRERIKDEELRFLYHSAAFVLCAAHHEPFGLVPLEAMACGAPVMAVREGGFQETILHQQTGLLLPRDSALWAETLEQCLSDQNLVTQFSSKGRQDVVSRWTWEHSVDKLEEIIKGKFQDSYAECSRLP